MFSAMVDSESAHTGGIGHQERDNPSKRKSGLYGLSVIACILYQRR